MNREINVCYPDRTTYPAWPWTWTETTTTAPNRLYYDEDQVAKLLNAVTPSNQYIEYSKDKDQALVLVKLPGFKKEDITADVLNDCISIIAKSNSEFIGKKVEQKVYLNGPQKEWECISAKLEAGVLTMELKVTKNKQKIAIH